jgi:hypothetical protein
MTPRQPSVPNTIFCDMMILLKYDDWWIITSVKKNPGILSRSLTVMELA